MSEQLAPFLSQRVQLSLKSVGEPLHTPLSPVSVWPAVGVPVIDGNVVGAGATAALSVLGLAAPANAKVIAAMITIPAGTPRRSAVLCLLFGCLKLSFM